jgi:3-oxoadipate enol-lactonase
MKIDGLEIHLDERGDGEPLLLIHGFPLSGEMWDGTLERLEGRWRAIVPDLRGHGRSEVGDDASMERLAADLLALLDGLEERRPCVVVGLSMGGYVALELARRAPERVRALVLVDTRAEADEPDAAATRRETAERVEREGSATVAETMAEKLFGPSAPDSLRQTWRRRIEATPPAGIAAALRGMARRSARFDVLEGWRRPALLVVGEEDTVTPPAAARRMREAAPHARLEVVPEAGHLVPVEKPAEFARILNDFLDSLPPLD